MRSFEGDPGVRLHLVKTPDAKPKVVLLALCKTSSSVSNGIMDITGPKISSFTQVMSSLQLSMNIVTYKRNTCTCVLLESLF